MFDDTVIVQEPIALYEFTHGGEKWYFTSSSEPHTYAFQTYTPIPILHEKIEVNTDLFKSTISINIGHGNDMSQRFVQRAFSKILYVTIYRMFGADRIVEWAGRVLTVDVEDEDIKMKCELASILMKKPALQRKYQKTCPHSLYGTACGALKESFALHNILVTDVSANGLVITLNHDIAVGDKIYQAGILMTETNQYERMIVDQDYVNDTVTIASPIWGLAAGDLVALYQGCDHTLTTCRDKFSNHLNFGGMPWIPSKNPFQTSLV